MRKFYLIALSIAFFVFAAVIIGSIDEDFSSSFARKIGMLFRGNGKAHIKKSSTIPPQTGTRSAANSIFIPDTRNKYFILIMDDAGMTDNCDALDFPHPLNISVIPHHSHTGLWVKKLKTQNIHEILLHIPMAAYSHQNSGIRQGMTTKQIEKFLSDCTASVPYYSGANNHQGSLATGNKKLMEKFFSVYKTYNKYFVDSVTFANSTAYHIAKKTGIPALKRDIFIDNNTSRQYLERQLIHAINIAEKRGFVVAIGHVTTRNFFSVLNSLAERFTKAGVKFIKISDFLRIKNMINAPVS